MCAAPSAPSSRCPIAVARSWCASRISPPRGSGPCATRRGGAAMTSNGTPPAGAQQAPPEEQQSPLERFGRDLTASAEQGKLDPVIGRDDEIRRVIQVLSRRTKNNPVLIGEPGVGKTAIVEGLAQRIVGG